MAKDGHRQVLKLRSVYAEDESDCLVFHQGEDGLELVETPFAVANTSKVWRLFGWRTWAHCSMSWWFYLWT